LVAERREPEAADGADCEVKLAEQATAQQLLAALVGAKVGVRRFEMVTPTLHQIFVDRVGAAATVAERRAGATWRIQREGGGGGARRPGSPSGERSRHDESSAQRLGGA